MDKEDLKNFILDASEGFLINLSDFVLCNLLFTINLSAPGYNTRKVYQAMRQANQTVDQIDYENFRRSLYYLRQKGLIESIKDKGNQLAITAMGRRKLQALFPTYVEDRPWDEKIYLVTYDIREDYRNLRELLREYLLRLGCAQLQKSVYVSVYDPRELLREWLKDYHFEGSVIVSDVGRDGSIAGVTIPELIGNLYKLTYIDSNYRAFIARYKQKQQAGQVDQWQLNLDWARCVEQDPQLPRELLPRNFADKKAYRLYKKLAKVDLEELQEDFTTKETSYEKLWELNEQKYLRANRRSRTSQE